MEHSVSNTCKGNAVDALKMNGTNTNSSATNKSDHGCLESNVTIL